MISADRRLVLHIGMSKTGSTALQVSFVRNREALAADGVYYPEHGSDRRASQGQIVSGNGVSILPALAPRNGESPEQSARARAKLVDTVAAAPQPTTLFSSEFLYYFRPELLEALRDELEHKGVALQVAVFVRDVAPHALSSYTMNVKRSLYGGTFSDYVGLTDTQRYGLSFKTQLSQLQDSLGGGNVTVMHYDTMRGSLFSGFISQVLGIEDTSPYDLEPGEVNRSLTQRELELMRRANERLDERRDAHLLSDALIALPPYEPGPLSITTAEAKHLEELFGDEVAWVNDTYFGGNQTLKLLSTTALVDDQGEILPQSTATESQLVLWMVTLAQRASLRDAEAVAALRSERQLRRRAEKRARRALAERDQARQHTESAEYRVGRTLVGPLRKLLRR